MVTNKEKNFISAVVYIYNCASNIPFFMEHLVKVLSTNYENFEIICVNDSSTDSSEEVVKRQIEFIEDGILTIVNMGYYQGIEAAMNAGVDLAIGDFVFEFDNINMDYDPNEIMNVYFHSIEGFDIVSASNTKKRFSSNVFYWLYNHAAASQYKLSGETFRILSRRAINRIHSMGKVIPYRKALYANCGLKIDTVTYSSINYQRAKHTKQQSKLRQDTALSSLILFTDIAYKLSMLMTGIMILATVATGIYVIVVNILGRPVAGFTTMMLVMTGCFFGVFAILAIIIKYLSVILDLVFKKQKYVIGSVEKVT